jgi:hypothetical protein
MLGAEEGELVYVLEDEVRLQDEEEADVIVGGEGELGADGGVVVYMRGRRYKRT